MQGFKDDLLRDIESYACGETPSPMTLLRAARLENWSARIGRRGKESVLLIHGDLQAQYDAGDAIKTSAVVWFDRHRRWIRTVNRLYVLGKPADCEGIDLAESG